MITMLLPLTCAARTEGDQWIKDSVGIAKILHSVPAFRGDLGSRLAAGAMGVEGIRLHKMTREDIAEDPLHWSLGDVELHILTTGEPEAAGCKILGSPRIIKRGKRYFPQDRTSMWLLTGKCALPD